MNETIRAQAQEAYENAAIYARQAAARAREAALAFEALADQLLAGDYKEASETHLRAVNNFAEAGEAVAACDDWLTRSSEEQ